MRHAHDPHGVRIVPDILQRHRDEEEHDEGEPFDDPQRTEGAHGVHPSLPTRTRSSRCTTTAAPGRPKRRSTSALRAPAMRAMSDTP